jgi:hypothetical protein
MTEEMQEQVQEQPVSQEPEGPPRFTIEDLKRVPGAPSQEQIDAWKQQFGKIYVLPLSMTEAYVWRYITRAEWMSLMSNQELVSNETMLQTQIVQRALLWPKFGPVELQSSRAGLIPTLFGVIMQGSYFLAPEVAIAMCEEL